MLQNEVPISYLPLPVDDSNTFSRSYCHRNRNFFFAMGGTIILAVILAVEILRISTTVNADTNTTIPPPYYLYPAPIDPPYNSTLVNVSSLYSVNVAFRAYPNASGNSFVYENDSKHREMYNPYIIPDQSVHWTSLASSDGLTNYTDGLTTITVTSLQFDIDQCIIRPTRFNIPCIILNKRQVQITTTVTMLKLSIELLNTTYGNSLTFMKHPLFIFIDPPEDPNNIFSPNDPHTLYFTRGIHILNDQVSLTFTVNQVYLEPGAYVIGGFIATVYNAPVKIMGRGIISGQIFPWHSPLFKWALVNIDQSTGSIIDGITLIDSPMFYTATYARDVFLNNLKLVVAWSFNSDGFDVMDNARIQNIFVRSNDDSIKLVGNNAIVENITVWQMINGAVVQSGWINVERSNTLVNQIDVIHVDYCHPNGNWCMNSDNEAVFDNCPDGTSGYTMNNVTIQNVRIEGDGVRLMYYALPNPFGGSISNLNFINISVDSLSLNNGADTNLFEGYNANNGINNVQIRNLWIGDKCISDAAQGKFSIDSQSVSNVTFSCPP